MSAMVTMQRIRNRTDELVKEAQAGFRPNRSTIDQLFTLRRLSELYIEFGKTLYVCCVDFQKALDSVWRLGLWRVMKFLGYDDKIVRLLVSLYEGTISVVRVDGSLSDWFITTIGELHGCILSPMLFNIFLEVVIALTLEGCEIGAKVLGVVVPNSCFADDINLPHSWVESRNSRVSIETLDFAPVPTFTGVIEVGSQAGAQREGAITGQTPTPFLAEAGTPSIDHCQG